MFHWAGRTPAGQGLNTVTMLNTEQAPDAVIAVTMLFVENTFISLNKCDFAKWDSFV